MPPEWRGSSSSSSCLDVPVSLTQCTMLPVIYIHMCAQLQAQVAEQVPWQTKYNNLKLHSLQIVSVVMWSTLVSKISGRGEKNEGWRAEDDVGESRFDEIEKNITCTSVIMCVKVRICASVCTWYALCRCTVVSHCAALCGYGCK